MISGIHRPRKERKSQGALRSRPRCRISLPGAKFRAVMAVLALFGLLALLLSFFVPLSVLFDNHSLRGGELGRLVDTLGRTLIFRYTMHRRQALLEELGIRQLPPLKDIINKRGIPNLPQAAVAQLLMLEKMRTRQILQAADGAKKAIHTPVTSGNCSHGMLANSTRIGIIPKLVLQPNYGDFFRPVRVPREFHIIHFDSSSMQRLLQDQCPTLVMHGATVKDVTAEMHKQTWIWALCALYSFGGIVIGPNYNNNHRMTDASIDNDLFDFDSIVADEGYHPIMDYDHDYCNHPNSFALFQEKGTTTTTKLDLALLASTPRHPRLKRILEMIASTYTAKVNDEAITNPQPPLLDGNELLRYFLGGASSRLLDGNDADEWNVLTCSCRKQTWHEDSDCCTAMDHYQVEKVSSATSASSDSIVSPRLHVKTLNSSTEDDHEGDNSSSNNNNDNNKVRLDDSLSGSKKSARPAFEVSIIDEEEATETATPGKASSVVRKVPKVPIRDILTKAHCNAGWICNRCLKNSLLGTHDACRLVCPSCYRQVMCEKDAEWDRALVKKYVNINVSVQMTRPLEPGEQRIPKIIHQTWFNEPKVDRYPQLARLQNSWKMNPGWEYRFYTDSDIGDYIAANYPSRFLDAFDSLIPGAFKADLFRYLVLLKDGGIYADADILLDINLDTFITSTMSFVVPRDIVGDYAGENFCLWNGLMGAVPGHPFMVHAAEALVNNIANRVDYHDMEREMCQTLGTNGEVWKMRALTILSLSGPCLLGNAVNKALGNGNYLSKYEPGWLARVPTDETETKDDNIGDALLLIASRADMGALRFSDVYRNLMVASTGMSDISKDPILSIEEAQANEVGEEEKEEDVSHIHYSKFEHVNDVFGAQGIYVDDLVTNEVIRLDVVRDDF